MRCFFIRQADLRRSLLSPCPSLTCLNVRNIRNLGLLLHKRVQVFCFLIFLQTSEMGSSCQMRSILISSCCVQRNQLRGNPEPRLSCRKFGLDWSNKLLKSLAWLSHLASHAPCSCLPFSSRAGLLEQLLQYHWWDNAPGPKASSLPTQRA